MKVGVTGGIGSGKTSVCRVFNVLQIPVFSADIEAREIMDTDEDIIRQVNAIAGKNMYEGGRLDRLGLATLIFNNKDLLDKINRTVHPVVFDRFKEWQKEQEADYVIFEAAILFESGAYKLVDRVIAVVAPIEERISRVVTRNKLTREQVLERIRNQTDDEYKINRSDWIIHNSEKEMILPVIIRIHQKLLKMVKEF